MSTRGCIARVAGEGKFEGVYHHWDSYVTGLGATLYKLYTGHFERDLGKMLTFLIDKHGAGWSTINGADFNLEAGYDENAARYEAGADGKPDYSKPIPHGPRCFCHGTRHEEAQLIDQDTDAGMEWAYVFDEEKRVMHVLERVYTDDTKNAGKHMTGMFGYGAEGHQRWADRASIELDGPAPDWEKVECGEHYEHCHHYASHHIKSLDGTASERVGMDDYLNEHPEFGQRDAVAYIVNGKVAKAGGSGFSGGQNWKPGTQSGVWYQSLVFADGSQRDVPVAYTTPEEKPYKGVVWVFPPTLHQGFTTRPELDGNAVANVVKTLKLVAEVPVGMKA
jgi:hypothetical protein